MKLQCMPFFGTASASAIRSMTPSWMPRGNWTTGVVLSNAIQMAARLRFANSTIVAKIYDRTKAKHPAGNLRGRGK